MVGEVVKSILAQLETALDEVAEDKICSVRKIIIKRLEVILRDNTLQVPKFEASILDPHMDDLGADFDEKEPELEQKDMIVKDLRIILLAHFEKISESL